MKPTKQYIVEHDFRVTFETNDKEEAKRACRENHRRDSTKYDEVSRLNPLSNVYSGIYQFKPNEQVPPEVILEDLKEIRRSLRALD